MRKPWRRQHQQLAFGCACSTRKMLGRGPYPGTCRYGVPSGQQARSVRLAVDNAIIEFEDRLQGPQTVALEESMGAFVIQRADGLTSYHLANVVDDAYLAITDVVRGVDFLASTPPHIHLARSCGWSAPRYAHIAVVTDATGQKLSNSMRLAAIWCQPKKFGAKPSSF